MSAQSVEFLAAMLVGGVLAALGLAMGAWTGRKRR